VQGITKKGERAPSRDAAMSDATIRFVQDTAPFNAVRAACKPARGSSIYRPGVDKVAVQYASLRGVIARASAAVPLTSFVRMQSSSTPHCSACWLGGGALPCSETIAKLPIKTDVSWFPMSSLHLPLIEPPPSLAIQPDI